MRHDGNVSALLTDLYELTMAASYFAEGMVGRATFELSVRSLPDNRNFLVACGIEEAIGALETWEFTGDDCDHLRSLGMFSAEFLTSLQTLRFSGSVEAVAEGEIVFAGEPILSVTAPLIQAQLIETLLLNTVSYQTAIASKAARIQMAAAGHPWVDFSARRDHGFEASLRVARAAYLAGATGTSNVFAGKAYGIPVNGTMAHSYVLAFPDEASAFRAYSRRFPQRSTLLIDTYETLNGARFAADVATELREEGIEVAGVRIDSGDLDAGSRAVRSILDKAGHTRMQIFVSGDLDEYAISELLAVDAPIDAFGVGTRLGTIEDTPALNSTYKLVEYMSTPLMKTSIGKTTLPGTKQMYRTSVADGQPYDVVALRGEDLPGSALLVPGLRDGVRVRPPLSLDEARGHLSARLAELPEDLRAVSVSPAPYDVRISPKLEQLAARVTSHNLD